MSSNVIVIGVAGASASGKSLLASTILEELASEKVAVIPEDSYYKDQSHLPFSTRVRTNYDHPTALDHSLLVQHLLLLKSGSGINIPIYDYKQHTRSDRERYIAPSTIIVLEGILLFVDDILRDLLDIKIYMDTPLDLCLLRRIERDVVERNRDIDSVITQYTQTVRPMFLKFIEPSKRHADLIVPNGGKNRVAIDVIKAKMKELLNHTIAINQESNKISSAGSELVLQ